MLIGRELRSREVPSLAAVALDRTLALVCDPGGQIVSQELRRTFSMRHNSAVEHVGGVGQTP
jgi:hypothetical protein